MRDVCSMIWLALIGLFRSRASLQAEILTLRHQLNVLRRKSPQRLTFGSIDRLVFAGLYRLAPGVLDALKIVRPETVITAGIVPASKRVGAGNQDCAVAAQRPRWRSVSSFARSVSPTHYGRTTASWRASQARHRCRANYRCKVYGEGKATAVPRVEDVPS